MRCGCLAQWEWSGPGEVALGGPKQRAVLALLVLEAGRVAPASRLGCPSRHPRSHCGRAGSGRGMRRSAR